MRSGGGKGGKKGKKLNQTTPPPESKPICYAWNNGQACKQTPCNFAHVCQICFATDHTKHNCPQAA